MGEKQAKKALNVAATQAFVASLLKYSTFEPTQRFWLDTTSPELNAVFGSKERGLPYGKLFELSGEEHVGKTVMGTILAGMAQRDGAIVIYVDLEDSRDPAWADRLGLDWKNVLSIYPKLVIGQKGKETSLPRLQGAEELLLEAELTMGFLHKQGFKKIFLLLDSIANLQTVMQGEAGTSGQTMRTRIDRAVLLSDVLPRWCGLAASYNAMIFLLNQVRQKIGMVFGDPLTTTGGRSLRHNCAIRVRIRRQKNGRLLLNKQVIGIKSVLTNFKNKAGQESVEGSNCGMKVLWHKTPADLEFMSMADLKAEEE
jgi:recombination protein RecA